MHTHILHTHAHTYAHTHTHTHTNPDIIDELKVTDKGHFHIGD